MPDDEPKIIIDEDWKSQVQREKEEAAERRRRQSPLSKPQRRIRRSLRKRLPSVAWSAPWRPKPCLLWASSHRATPRK